MNFEFLTGYSGFLFAFRFTLFLITIRSITCARGSHEFTFECKNASSVRRVHESFLPFLNDGYPVACRQSLNEGLSYMGLPFVPVEYIGCFPVFNLVLVVLHKGHT